MKKIILTSLFFTPLLASAFAFPDLRSFSEEVLVVLDIIFNILIAIAFIAFFWGVAKFILSSGSEQGITEGKNFMIYGVLALFILVSFKGILLFFSGQFEFGNTLERPLLPSSHNTSTFTPIPLQ
ncbi:MAG: hypothetical protein ACYCZW_03190 [Minisyncoccota bacterium]